MNAPTSSIPGLACHLRDRAVNLVMLDLPGVRSLILTAAVDVDGTGSAEVRAVHEDGTSHARSLNLHEIETTADTRLRDLIETAVHSAPCAGRIDTDQCVFTVSEVGDTGLVLVGLSVDIETAQSHHLAA